MVVKEEPLELLYHIALHIAGGKGKDPVRLMNQAAGTVKIALEYLVRCLAVKILQFLQHIPLSINQWGLLYLQHRLQIPKAVKAQLLGEPDNGGAGHRAGLGQLMDRDMAHLPAVLNNIFPNGKICFPQLLQMLVDDFFQSHGLTMSPFPKA